MTKLADFEGLIRQALARQDASDPVVRQKVYQSSRNALAKMIAAAGASEPAAINEQRNALENSINRIEAGFAPPVILEACHEKCLEIVTLADLKYHQLR